MTALIAGWAAVVAVVLGAIARPWRPGLNRSLFALGPAAVMAAWVTVTGAIAYDDAIAKQAWTGATLTIPIIGLKAVVISVIGYYAGYTSAKAWQNSGAGAAAWALPLLLGAVCAYTFGSDAMALHVMCAERQAASTDLTDTDIARIADRVISKTAYESEAQAFIANPKCPAELLQRAARGPDTAWRIAAARNPALPLDDLTSLARDPEARVRLYAVYADRLPPEIYAALVDDPDEYVREALAWKEDLPDANFITLLLDPSESVRKTAESRWSYRTGPSEDEVRRAYEARSGKAAP